MSTVDTTNVSMDIEKIKYHFKDENPGIGLLILEMINKYPNDKELGEEIRKHFKNYLPKSGQ